MFSMDGLIVHRVHAGGVGSRRCDVVLATPTVGRKDKSVGLGGRRLPSYRTEQSLHHLVESQIDIHNCLRK